MAKSRYERIILVMGLFLVLVGFGYGLADWGGSNAWEKYKREWEVKGEKFDFKDFAPPPVPDDQNFAMTPIVASSYGQVMDRNGRIWIPQHTNVVNRLDMDVPGGVTQSSYVAKLGNWQEGRLTDFKGLQAYFYGLKGSLPRPAEAPIEGTPADNILRTLSPYDQDIEELRAAARLPGSRFPLNYDTDRPSDILLPHLAALKRCSSVLELRSLAELEKGDNEKALQDVKLMLRLSDSVRQEPFLISSLVRLSIVSLALQPVWEGMQNHRWTDHQLAELERDFDHLDFLEDYENVMRGDRAMAIATIEYVRRTGRFGSPNADDPQTDASDQTLIRFMPRSIFYHNEQTLCQIHQEWLLPAADTNSEVVFPDRIRGGQAVIDKLGTHFSPNNILVRLLIPGITGAATRFAYSQNAIHLAQIACALERYRQAHGGYPETLDVLAPQFIDRIPRDVIGGEPLRYQRTGDGSYHLYSVGWNQVDDDGKVVFYPQKKIRIDYGKGDWVWQGATAK